MLITINSCTLTATLTSNPSGNFFVFIGLKHEGLKNKIFFIKENSFFLVIHYCDLVLLSILKCNLCIINNIADEKVSILESISLE